MVEKRKKEDDVRRKVRRDFEVALAKEKKSNGEAAMILAENDDGFASCEEEDMLDLEKRRTGDPIQDFHLDLLKVKDKEAVSKFLYLNFKGT